MPLPVLQRIAGAVGAELIERERKEEVSGEERDRAGESPGRNAHHSQQPPVDSNALADEIGRGSMLTLPAMADDGHGSGLCLFLNRKRSPLGELNAEDRKIVG